MKFKGFFILSLMLLLNCSKKDQGSDLIKLKEKALNSRKEITNAWQIDSTGCEGIREKILENESFLFDSIIGLRTDQISMHFGKANFIDNKTNRMFYFIECKYAPAYFNQPDNEGKLTKRIINTESQTFFLEFNTDSIIIDRGLIVP
ncbi:hypothetical protein I5M27_17555 [Adhaeribacter sp. BT258]|uniref:Lipoprotein n=1 Tax=Adhaeribacter terrigena TaxID=2793070 RepID=A0ABS1C5Z9_9BACT|nr:hypothetical protein [Adhaeribacter terrigena]MBK0404802.1 hypothetical protein [Adhaeribacter terrigena]